MDKIATTPIKHPVAHWFGASKEESIVESSWATLAQTKFCEQINSVTVSALVYLV